MPAATKKNLMEWLNLDSSSASVLAKLIKDASDPEEVDQALDVADEMMNAHGIEGVRGDYHVDNYYLDIVALYVNTGDSYNPTLLYETERERFLVTTWGDWVESNQNRYNIQ